MATRDKTNQQNILKRLVDYRSQCQETAQLLNEYNVFLNHVENLVKRQEQIVSSKLDENSAKKLPDDVKDMLAKEMTELERLKDCFEEQFEKMIESNEKIFHNNEIGTIHSVSQLKKFGSDHLECYKGVYWTSRNELFCYNRFPDEVQVFTYIYGQFKQDRLMKWANLRRGGGRLEEVAIVNNKLIGLAYQRKKYRIEVLNQIDLSKLRQLDTREYEYEKGNYWYLSTFKDKLAVLIVHVNNNKWLSMLIYSDEEFHKKVALNVEATSSIYYMNSVYCCENILLLKSAANKIALVSFDETNRQPVKHIQLNGVKYLDSFVWIPSQSQPSQGHLIVGDKIARNEDLKRVTLIYELDIWRVFRTAGDVRLNNLKGDLTSEETTVLCPITNSVVFAVKGEKSFKGEPILIKLQRE